MINFFLNLFQFHNLYSILILILFGCSVYGWSHTLFLKKLSNYTTVNMVIGMSIILFIGGILNYFNLAYEILIKIIFFLGLIFFFIIKKINQNFFKNINILQNSKKIYFIFLLPIALLIVSIFSSINPDAYNYHDDFQKYFVHPIKMLEAGSVFGSTLSAIGQQTLGGQAFFQSFFVSFLGLNSINIFDSVFCLSLSVFLLLELSVKERIPIFGSLVACLLVLIHPQYVNISSLYSGVLFILTAIILSLEFLSNYRNNNFFYIKFILALGFSFSSLIVLKTNNVVFPLIYFLIFISLIFIFLKISKPMLYIIFITPLLSLIFVIPWLAYPFKLFINSIDSTNQPINLNIELLQIEPYYKKLLSNDLLFYGGTQLSYTSISIAGLLLAFLTIFFLKRSTAKFFELKNETLFLSLVSIISGVVIYFLFIFIGSKHASILHLTRYSVPFIASTIPVGLIILYVSIPKDFIYLRSTFFFVVIILSINFFPHYLKRTIQSHECGSQLSFSYFACNENYINYNNEILKKEKKIFVQKLQKNIPEHKTIMTWTNAPFYFDFKRNEIIDISIGGFDNPWTKFPSGEYMIWEYDGFATRSIEDLQNIADNGFLIDKRIAIRTLQHIKEIIELSKSGKIKVINNDGSVLIFKFL